MSNDIEIVVTSKDRSGPGIDSAERRVKGLGREAERSGGKLRTFATIGSTAGGKLRAGLGLAAGGIAGLGLGVTGLAAVAGPRILDLGVRIEAMGNKAKVVFGSSLPVVSKWADTAAAKMGLTTTEAKGLAAGIGDLLTPMGFTQAKAAQMSVKVEDLAGALAQWSNGALDTAGANEILAAALTGEYDSLKSVGVQIDAQMVKEALHKQGKDKLTGAAKKQAEAEFVLAEITRQSSNAITGYNSNTNKLGLAKAKLSAQVKTLRDRLVTALIPAMTAATTWLGSKLPGAIAAVNGWFARNKTTIQNVGLVLVEFGLKAAQVFLRLVANVANFVGQTLHFLGIVTDGFLGFVSTMLNAGIKAFGWVPGVGDKLRTARADVDKFRDKVKSGMEMASQKALAFAAATNRAADKMGEAKDAATRLRDRINQLKSKAITITAKTGQSATALQAIRDYLAAIKSKTIVVTTQYGFGYKAGPGQPTANAHGGIIGAAGGGARSALTWVGEQGAELVRLPFGSRVYSNPDSRRMTSQAGGQPPVNVTLEVQRGGSRLDDLFLDWLRDRVRARGGNVQVVLGR